MSGDGIVSSVFFMMKNLHRIPLAVVAIAASAAALTGCSTLERSMADTYLITYEVVAGGSHDGVLPRVEVQESPTRGDASALLVKENQKLTSTADGATWSDDVLVTAGDRARVVVDGQEGVTLTCRILMDETTVLETQEGAAGAGVDCETQTKPFS